MISTQLFGPPFLSAAPALQPQALTAALGGGASGLTAAEGLDGGTNELADLLGSVNALQTLAGALGGASTSSGGSLFQPTIPPYKPIDPIDQRTVRDSILDDGQQTSGTAAA
jgi:hypothetical protein